MSKKVKPRACLVVVRRSKWSKHFRKLHFGKLFQTLETNLKNELSLGLNFVQNDITPIHY